MFFEFFKDIVSSQSVEFVKDLKHVNFYLKMLSHFQWKSQAYASWLGLLKIYYIALNWFYVWYEAETYTRGTPWQQLLINDVKTLVTWPVCILLTRNHFCRHQQKWKNDVMNEFLLSRWLTGESFNLIPATDPKTWHSRYFCW